MKNDTEVQAVIARYARRGENAQRRYAMEQPEVWQVVLERQKAMVRLLSSRLNIPFDTATLLEVGCGSGMNLLEFLRMGFRPGNLVGNELLPERLSRARETLPELLRLYPGDASQLPFAEGTFDIVFQSTVFTSLLDDEFRKMLAQRMWSWVKPGGGVLWYDFTFDHPGNPDVRGVRPAEIRSLFPHASIAMQRLTLAPPINRRVTGLHPHLYTAFNLLPFLRTHVLCWIEKRI